MKIGLKQQWLFDCRNISNVIKYQYIKVIKHDYKIEKFEDSIKIHQLGNSYIYYLERSLIMPDRIHNIIYQFSQQLKEIMGSKLTKVIVYGSYARGDYNSNSDVDVMILVKMSSSEIKKIENQVYDLAFDIEMDTGVDISPIIKNEDQYEYWLDTLPFYKNIHEEGVVVNG